MMVTKRCQECVDLYPGAPCPKHAVSLPAPEVIKMYCDHGLVPPEGCKACWDENPRNWDNPPNWIKNERIVPLSEILPPGSRETRRFKTARKESECQSQDLLPPTTS